MFDDHPIEELPFADKYFDLVVMINVLDHVRDARLCMKNVMRIVKPDGILIIGQDLTNEANRLRTPQDFRTGHPITLDAEWFKPHLSAFDPLLKKNCSCLCGLGMRNTPRHYDLCWKEKTDCLKYSHQSRCAICLSDCMEIHL